MYIKLLESDRKLEKELLKAWIIDLNIAIRRSIPSIEKRIIRYIPEIFNKSAVYASLVSGSLVGEFGFPRDSAKRINTILRDIANAMVVDFKPIALTTTTRFTGGLTIKVLQADFLDILGTSAANITTDKGINLPWLQWLLLEGNHYIISDYEINFTTGTGRSGMATMVKSKSGSWRVPTQFAGTARNNWLTRDIDAMILNIESEFATIISDEIDKAIP